MRRRRAGDWLALRYDLTAPLARVYAQHRNDLPTPYRRYAMGPVWRNEKPGPGRFRQFYQCDADTVGAASVAADAEICAMLADALEAVGIPRGDYIVRVNNRKVLNGVLEVAGVLDPADPTVSRGARHRAARHRQARQGWARRGCARAAGRGPQGRERGFHRRGGAERRAGRHRHGFMDAKRARHRRGDAGAAARPGRGSVGRRRGRGRAGTDRRPLAAQGYGPDRIVIDPSVVRGLGYYTGPVYEAELTFEILDEKGRKRQFGSVAGGGRYDDLVKRFTGQAVPATGVSIGVDRLLAALRAKGRIGARAHGARRRHRDGPRPDGRLPGDGGRAARRRHPRRGLLGNPKNFGNQLKYADKRKARSR
jgi:histidyl-tRNA synthetase